jgi:serine/threonine-protein phosphatase 2A regulatory subunit A
VVNLSKVIHHIYPLVEEGFDGKTEAMKLAKSVDSLADDDNEMVRGALAMVITEIALVLPKDDCISHLMPAVSLLFRDISAEVRLNIISSLDPLSQTIGVDLLTLSLYPSIVDLANDAKWRIRLAIMQHIPLLAKHFGQEYFTEKLLPLCVAWLSDSICRVREAASINMRVGVIVYCWIWLHIFCTQIITYRIYVKFSALNGL